ncbi:MAG: hypothetical protein U0231_16450 [Nitrospiraceae bacterium]
MTDSSRRKVDFKNTVVIMTSNIGTKLIQKGVSFGIPKRGTLGPETPSAGRGVGGVAPFV